MNRLEERNGLEGHLAQRQREVDEVTRAKLAVLDVSAHRAPAMLELLRGKPLEVAAVFGLLLVVVSYVPSARKVVKLGVKLALRAAVGRVLARMV
ncbi:MAG: hypothetical protein HYV26_24360 [Candidatus Hydrogenedentes bacterium]|nr:hypothetical protein [Candidatus Hydrogenedentota bacterium]